jgi:hypothetical protein
MGAVLGQYGLDARSAGRCRHTASLRAGTVFRSPGQRSFLSRPVRLRQRQAFSPNDSLVLEITTRVRAFSGFQRLS